MGGHTSRQTIDLSTGIFTSASMRVAQNCLTFMDGSQVISVYGSGIVFKGNIQRSTLSVDSKCVSQLSQKDSFTNELTNRVAQELKDQELALTQWMDPSGDDQDTDVSTMVATAIEFKDVQNCLGSLQGTQLFIIRGNDDEIVGNLQEQTLALASTCLMGGKQAVNAVNSVTNTINQHSTYDSKNPFAFITDAIETTFKSAMAMAAVVFIAIVVLIFVFEIGTDHGKSRTSPMMDFPAASRQ
ncbi:protein E248R [Elysia marginata]|uniref:Protein E248R n=1 Tax=Elysia marginata TaxID=1093978 RepID=A0AAV4GTT1_9GAST|nr:protein E248R [Elysia marginata]